MDGRDCNVFLQQYRDMIRYIMTHRRIIRIINLITLWSTIIGFLSSSALGFEVLFEGVPEEKRKVVYGTLAFSSAVTTGIKELPWIQRRFKNQHKLLTDFRGWQTQFYTAARKFYETKDIKYIRDAKTDFESAEDDLINREGNEDVIMSGWLMHLFSNIKPKDFESQYKMKYNRVSSFVDYEGIVCDSPDEGTFRRGITFTQPIARYCMYPAIRIEKYDS